MHSNEPNRPDPRKAGHRRQPRSTTDAMTAAPGILPIEGTNGVTSRTGSLGVIRPPAFALRLGFGVRVVELEKDFGVPIGNALLDQTVIYCAQMLPNLDFRVRV
jgi:hypothetical protein